MAAITDGNLILRDNSGSPVPLAEFDRTPTPGDHVQTIAANAQGIAVTGGDVAFGRAWFTSQLTTGDLITVWTDDSRDIVRINQTTQAATAYLAQSALRALLTTSFAIDAARMDDQDRLVIVYHTFAAVNAIRVARINADLTLDLDQLVYTNGGLSPYDTINYWPITISPNGEKLAYGRKTSGSPYDTVDFIEYDIATDAETTLATKGGEYTGGAILTAGLGLAVGFDTNNDPLFGWEEQIVGGGPDPSPFTHDFSLYVTRYGSAPDQWLINHWGGNPAITADGYQGSSQHIFGLIAADTFGGERSAWVWWHFNFDTTNNHLTSVNLDTDVVHSNTFNAGSTNADWVPVWVWSSGAAPAGPPRSRRSFVHWIYGLLGLGGPLAAFQRACTSA